MKHRWKLKPRKRTQAVASFDPLGADPTLTLHIRRRLVATLNARGYGQHRRMEDYEDEDCDDEDDDESCDDLLDNVRKGTTRISDRALWRPHLLAAYVQGLGRSFDQVRAGASADVRTTPTCNAAYDAARRQMIRDAYRARGAWQVGAVLNEALTVLGSLKSPQQRNTLARLAVVKAHAEGQLDGLEALGVKRVKLVPERLAGPTANVCSHKRGLSCTINEARDLVPFHIGCRCTWAPAADAPILHRRTALDELSYALTGNFDPDEARDPAGKWTAGGEGVGGGGLAGVMGVKDKVAEAGAAKIKTMETAKIASREPAGSGINGAEKLTLEGDGAAAFKPGAHESPALQRAIPQGTQYRREAAAYSTALAIGMHDLMPPTTIRTVDGKEGSMQHWETGATDACRIKGFFKSSREKITFDGEEDHSRAAALDYLMANSDRHSGNWKIKDGGPDKGKLVLIDNGTSFPTKHGGPINNAELFGAAISRKLSVPAEMKDLMTHWPKIEEGLRKAGIEEPAIKLTRARAQKLQQVARQGGKFTDLWAVFQQNAWDPDTHPVPEH